MKKALSLLALILSLSLSLISCTEEEITPTTGGDNGGGGVFYDKIVK